MTYKWETLKKKAILVAVGNCEYFCEKVAPLAIIEAVQERKFGGRDHKNGWRLRSLAMRQKVIQIIERWDVRRAKSLIDLFPGIVSDRFMGQVPVCYIADNKNADWMVEFREEPACSR